MCLKTFLSSILNMDVDNRRKMGHLGNNRRGTKINNGNPRKVIYMENRALQRMGLNRDEGLIERVLYSLEA